MIPYGRQCLSEADVEAVLAVLKSDFLTQGPVTPRFEHAIAECTGARESVAVNSATSALHIACLALGVKPGDSVWTSPNTFVASANCVIYCGANIDFVDIDPGTYNMSVDRLREKLEHSERIGRLPKVVIPVHFAGQPCDMHSIHTLSKQYGFKVIEDASHAIGSTYGAYGSDKYSSTNEIVKVGSCTHSDITVFSFHPVKIITTGEGGMATTNDTDLAARMRRLRSHGVATDYELMKPRPEDEIWNYQQIELGFNYRLNEIQAALGMSQLGRLGQFVKRRREIADEYNAAFREIPIITPYQMRGTSSSFHLYPIRVSRNRKKITQRKVYDTLWRNNIAANLHYIPVHRQPYYENLGFSSGDFPAAECFHREAISLPIFPSMTNGEIEWVIKVIKSIYE